VYAVTTYLNDHPGGIEIITDVGGTDATEAYDDVGHSEEAHQILAKYYIGDLVAGAPMSGGGAAPAAKQEPAKPAAVAAAPAPVAAVKAPAAPKPALKKPVEEDDNSMLIMGGLAAAAAAVAFALYRRSKA
jgi:cytochrome b involved in lipid metabolism